MFTDIKNDISKKWQNGDAYIRLIIINIAAFLLILLPGVVASVMSSNEAYRSFVLNYFCLPSSLGTLVFRPWTIITHIFVHFDPMHLVSNILMLNFCGSLLFGRVTNSIFYRVYFLSGMAGVAAFIVGGNLLLQFSGGGFNAVAYGCSACVMGCLVCVTVLNPHQIVNLFLAGPVKMMYITAFLVLIDLVYLYSTNSGGHIAHLGGSLFGWWYGTRILQGSYPGSWIDKAIGLLSFKPKPKMKVTHRRSVSDEDYNAQKKANQEEIDAILDKISRSGYDSLSAREKEILFKASK